MYTRSCVPLSHGCTALHSSLTPQYKSLRFVGPLPGSNSKAAAPLTTPTYMRSGGFKSNRAIKTLSQKRLSPRTELLKVSNRLCSCYSTAHASMAHARTPPTEICRPVTHSLHKVGSNEGQQRSVVDMSAAGAGHGEGRCAGVHSASMHLSNRAAGTCQSPAFRVLSYPLCRPHTDAWLPNTPLHTIGKATNRHSRHMGSCGGVTRRLR